jgi:membrane-anchored protein YejM (alkaline phosphatase superfamily)
VHYLDPHYPYSPPKEYERLFKNDLLYQENDKIWATFIPTTKDEHMLIGAFSGYRYPLNELISCYDAEINFVDYNVGRILRSLPRDAVIIITADHGESLGEDNECGHGSFTETTLHIPLIIKDNKHFKGGKSILSAVSSIDIVPTILNTVSRVYYFFLRGKFQGIDLSELLKQDRGRRKYIYSYNPPIAIIREVNKNIVLPNYNHKGYKRTDDRQDLFLLRQEMKKTLKRWLRNNSTPSSLSPNKGKLDKDTLDNLRNLGYTQ